MLTPVKPKPAPLVDGRVHSPEYFCFARFDSSDVRNDPDILEMLYGSSVAAEEGNDISRIGDGTVRSTVGVSANVAMLLGSRGLYGSEGLP